MQSRQTRSGRPRRLSFAAGLMLLAAGARADYAEEDEAVWIEDLEEIPREEWPDISRHLVTPLDHSGERPVRERYSAEELEGLWSPFVVNDQTYEEWSAKQAVGRRLEYVQSELSNECKQCIDDNSKWCPSSNYSSGYCCSGNDWNSCPRAGKCSDEFQVRELQYLLCPNEVGCMFSRNIAPPTNGSIKGYEQFDGGFYNNDLCSFKITNPYASDYNDVMFMRVEYYKNCFPILIKGESMVNPVAMYRPKAGQNYTALKGINFYLLWQAT